MIKIPESEKPLTFKAVSVESDTGGSQVFYKNGKKLSSVLIPPNYQYAHLDGYAVVGKKDGNNSACPIKIGTFIGEPCDPECPAESMDILFAHQLLGRAGKTLKGKTDIPWMWIIIVFVAIILLFVGYQFLKSDNTTDQVQVTPIEQSK